MPTITALHVEKQGPREEKGVSLSQWVSDTAQTGIQGTPPN